MRLPAKSAVKTNLRQQPRVSLPKASLLTAKVNGIKTQRDYRKKALKDAAEFGNVGFGRTGLTGES
jgi:hypothetical protein